MAKFRSWNKEYKCFIYFKDGKYYITNTKGFKGYRGKDSYSYLFNWQNAELIDCKEKQLLLCQLRRKKKTLEDIIWHIDDIENFKSGYGLIKQKLIADKNIKECEIDNLECALIDVFHMTDKELKKLDNIHENKELM